MARRPRSAASVDIRTKLAAANFRDRPPIFAFHPSYVVGGYRELEVALKLQDGTQVPLRRLAVSRG